MGGMKHAIDEAANEILRAKGIDRGVGSIEELAEGERLVDVRLAEMDLLSQKYDHDILEDYFRQGVCPGPEYFRKN